MDEIEDVNKDIDIYKLVFIGSNRGKLSFNIFRMPLNFLSSIYNGQVALDRIYSKRFIDEINELKYNYKPKNVKEEEEINEVLMQANNMLEYRDKIIEAFRDGTFSSEYLKKSDDAAHDYVLKDVNDFIQEIILMEENINLSLLEDFFESSSPADYAKMLINNRNADENKGIVAEVKDRI